MCLCTRHCYRFFWDEWAIFVSWTLYIYTEELLWEYSVLSKSPIPLHLPLLYILCVNCIFMFIIIHCAHYQHSDWPTAPCLFWKFTWFCGHDYSGYHKKPPPIIVYYSFKIFPRFWLVKTTRIIHHNQLLWTKFEENFVLLNQWRQKCNLLQIIEPFTEKTWAGLFKARLS